MARRALPALLLSLPAILAACAQSSGVRTVRQTSDGGTILVGGGTGSPAATRQAVSIIEQHCHGVYEVMEIAQVQTGQSRSAGMSFGMGPVAVGTSGSVPVFSTSITYLCRPPQSTTLNEMLIRAGTADIVGRTCAKDDDCGPLFCARATPSDAEGKCTPER